MHIQHMYKSVPYDIKMYNFMMQKNKNKTPMSGEDFNCKSNLLSICFTFQFTVFSRSGVKN